MARIVSIDDVVSRQLCTGCGACAYMEPGRYKMDNSLSYGMRPFLHVSPVPETKQGLEVCPGVRLSHPDGFSEKEGIIQDLVEGWGPVYGVWEGYATDEEIRYSAASGGAASALALYCLEREGMAGVLHTAAKKDARYLNETVMSKCRTDILASTGSRYAPASPAEGLKQIEDAKSQCVFIGKPCDVAAVQNARVLKPKLDENLGLVIGFFCAGVPSTKGTLDLLKVCGVDDLARLKDLRYRGNGWPGVWVVRYLNHQGKEESRQMSYAESWGFLEKYRQWRCYICPDHTGEFADIAVGDPWYREVQAGEPGKSLIVARTKHGLKILKAAQAAGYVVLESDSASLLPRSQPNLLSGRGSVWGRLLTLRLFGVAAPRYRGFQLFRTWFDHLVFRQKIQSIVGTGRRIFTKKLKKRIQMVRWRPPSG